MKHVLQVFLRVLTASAMLLAGVVLIGIGLYPAIADSNHTGYEPWLLLWVFVPALLIGTMPLVFKQSRALGFYCCVLALLGIATLRYLDRFNVMVQYDRWLERGMPD